MNKLTRQITGMPLLLAVLGCSDSMMAPLPDVAGDWTFSDSVSAAFGVCTARGIATFEQTGSALTGVINATEGVCIWEDGGSDDNSGPVEISTGELSATSISFSAGICQFESTFIGPDRIDGNEVCPVVVLAGQTFEMIGTFSLTR